MQIPTLETARLRLVPPSLECEAAYEAFFMDASASCHYGGPLSAGQAFARLAADLGAWHLSGFGVWAIELRAERAVVGTCGFWQGKGWPPELTWWLLPSARSKGFAFEASNAAITHAYQAFRWPSVHTYMNDENAVARGLALRLGGQLIARRSFPDGRERDVFFLPQPAAA